MEIETACNLLDYKMDSLQYALRKLNLSYYDLCSERRHGKALADKRWAVFYFLRLGGKSYSYIGNVTKHDHSSVMYAIKHITPTIKAVAEELFCLYVTEILHEPCPEFPELKRKEKVLIKVPDYKHSKTVTKAVDVDEACKPIKRIRRWDL